MPGNSPPPPSAAQPPLAPSLTPPTSQAELMELEAPSEGPATATVVEARLDRGAGSLATVVVKVG